MRRLLRRWAYAGLVVLIPPTLVSMTGSTWAAIVVWFMVASWIMGAIVLLAWCNERVSHLSDHGVNDE